MWKNRLFGGVVLATVLAATAVLATTATATPTKKQDDRSSSASSPSSRSTSSSPSRTPRRSGTRRTPGAKVLFAQGKSGTDDAGEIAAIQNMVAQGVKGIAITPTSAAVVPALNKARQGRASRSC